jgi:hypothetical protein
MKTVQEIINYLEKELAEAFEMHDQTKGKDKQQATFYLLKAMFISNLLEEIEEE